MIMNFFFSEIVPFMRYAEKYGGEGQTTDDNITRRMRIACWITEARIQTRVHNI
jgi:hypothetical protein